MIITKETDYALRILRVLSNEQKYTMAEISANEMIPTSFAYKILRKLDKAGIVQVTRGFLGGCQLNKDLAGVSLYDLMVAIGEKGVLSACMAPAYSCPWRERYGTCNVHNSLSTLQRNMIAELNAISLKYLLSGELCPHGKEHPCNMRTEFTQKQHKSNGVKSSR